MKTRERENTNKSPRRDNARKFVERLETNFGGKKYDTQFTSTGNRKTYFMHDMHKIAMDVTFTQ